MPELEQLTFRQVDPPAGAPAGSAVYQFVAPGDYIVAQAEVFPAPTQWGVRVQDRMPNVSDADLLRVVAKLLVWEIGCPADTVDVVLGRTHEHHSLVKVGGDYV